MVTMPTIAEPAARAWCEGFARTLLVRPIQANGQPYLERYYAPGSSPSDGPSRGATYLHHFVASDPVDALHSHPWDWSVSLILVGGYREMRCGPNGTLIVREFRPGHVNVITCDDRHRIDLLESDCWTVFCAGTVRQPWRFSPDCT
jgi:hypothetical protein